MVLLKYLLRYSILFVTGGYTLRALARIGAGHVGNLSKVKLLRVNFVFVQVIDPISTANLLEAYEN